MKRKCKQKVSKETEASLEATERRLRLLVKMSKRLSMSINNQFDTLDQELVKKGVSGLSLSEEMFIVLDYLRRRQAATVANENEASEDDE